MKKRVVIIIEYSDMYYAEERLSEYNAYEIVSVTPFVNRLVVILEREE